MKIRIGNYLVTNLPKENIIVKKMKDNSIEHWRDNCNRLNPYNGLKTREL